MRLTSFVVWKSWVSNPVRTLLTVLGVALGIAVVTAIHVLDHNTIQSQLAQRVADYGRVDLELLPKDAGRKPEDVRDQLLRTERIAAVGLQHGGEHGAPVQVTAEGTPPVHGVLYGLSPLPTRAFAHYVVRDGEDLNDLDGDGFALIGAELARATGWTRGTRITIGPPAVPGLPRCVDGKLVTTPAARIPGERVEVQVKGVLGHHGVARRQGGMVLIGSFALSRRVAPTARSYYQVNRATGTDPDELKRALTADFQVLDSRSAMLGEGSDERAFRNGIKILGLLALVMGMLVVFQTLSQTLVERLKQIGLMRCLGASRRAVAAIFLVDGLMLAALGVVLGSSGGVFLAWLMGKMEWTTLGVGKQIGAFEVPPRPVLFAAGLGVLFTLAGSAFPLWKARNLPPIRVLQARGLGDSGYLLRGVNLFLFVLLVVVLPLSYLAMTPLLTPEGRETRNVLLQVAGLVALFGTLLLVAPRLVAWGGRQLLRPLRARWLLPGFLVERAMARSPGRFSASVCGLAVVLVAMVALKHITSALRAEVTQFSAVAMDDHLYFDQGEPRPREDLSGLRGVPGVQRADFITGSVDAGFLLRGMPVDDLVREGGVLHGEVDAAARYRSARCLIVSRRWAELNWKKAKQSTSVLTGSGPKSYEILMVSDRAGFFPDERAWAVTDAGWLQKDFCVDQRLVRQVVLKVAPGTNSEEVRTAVKERFPHAWFKTGNEHREYLIRDVTRDFLMFDVLLVLILGLVGMGLVNTMTIAAIGRAREIGVLRALGMTDQQLRRVFLVEGGVVAALGSVVAVVMGLPLGWVVVEGLNRVAGLQAPVVVPWGWVVLVPVLAGVTGVVSAVLPGSRAVRMRAVDAVRYE